MLTFLRNRRSPSPESASAHEKGEQDCWNDCDQLPSTADGEGRLELRELLLCVLHVWVLTRRADDRCACATLWGREGREDSESAPGVSENRSETGRTERAL